MSRTDKTAPWRVKVLYYPAWVEEYHDHTGGECDLPARPAVGNVSNVAGGNCGWTFSMEFRCSGMQRCGCRMCNRDPFYEVPKRKRDRMAGRRYVRRGWRKEY